MKRYDVIVAGVGSMGASACYYLAKKGYRVLGLEQFTSPHTEGSHAGQSRIIRKAYFEHPDYVPLLNKAYTIWDQLEQESGGQLFFRTGLAYYGPHDHPVMQGVKQAASLHGITIKNQAPSTDLFLLPATFETIFEPDAGFLQPERAIAVLKEQAVCHGAQIREDEKITGFKKENGGITITTSQGTYYTHKLIITAGAWAGKLIPELNQKLKITRQVIVWMQTHDPGLYFPDHFPCWLIADHKRPGALYGFPYLQSKEFGDPEGLKFAWHHPAEETDPDQVNRDITKAEINDLVHSVATYITGVSDMKLAAAKTCLYANSPDEDFIIDLLPGYDGDVAVACGFSGHGFKFAPVAGELLGELVMQGKTSLPAAFLGLQRFQ